MQELEVECAPIENAPKPKGFIQWVSDPIFCEIRLYERLCVPFSNCSRIRSVEPQLVLTVYHAVF